MTLMTEQAAVVAHLTAENAALKAEIAILLAKQAVVDDLAARREQTQQLIYREAHQ
ncbi:MAG: hypothetical protein WA191_07005 [Telluria sp.]